MLINYHPSTYRLADLMRISSNKHIYTAKRNWLHISYQKRIPVVDSIIQSVHPTGNATIAETSNVQPKDSTEIWDHWRVLCRTR